jgi:hypothetical protein
MSKPKTPKETLRHHVTGAIERGEKTAITAIDAPKHTPGPWSFDDEFVFSGSLPGSRRLVAKFSLWSVPKYPSDVDKANAALIAAAPDLLEALKQIVASAHEDRNPGHVSRVVVKIQDVYRAEDAIARAEGKE